MYQFYLRISKINEKYNTSFISPEKLTSYFDVALNKRNAGQGAVFRVWLFPCNDSMFLAFRKLVSETKCYLSNTIERLTYLSTLTLA